jgi:predicted GIY-YIG superfamily endonuclease
MAEQETLTGDDCMYPAGELRATASPLPGQVALYRFYDVHEGLLYVGISNDPRRRWKEHAQTKPWYRQVRHQALTWYGTEWEARSAESLAIRQESPQFNIAGAIRPPRARFTIRPHRWALFGWFWMYAATGVMYVVAFTRPTPLLLAVLPPVTEAVAAMMALSALAALVVSGAPQIRRFGSWIERNSVAYHKKGTP